jgi:hypothetical protein
VRFDEHGRVLLSPRHVHDGLADCEWLINRWLLPGTPHIFDTYDSYHRFLNSIADALYIPPLNVCVRGSGKIGFSIAPREEKVWMEVAPDADVDVGIVDVDYFNVIHREIERWLRSAPADEGRDVSKKIRKTRGFEYYRYFDLPEAIQVVAQHNESFKRAGEAIECVQGRVVTAFIYRDWWSVIRRYRFDLEKLNQGLMRGVNPLPAGGDRPRPYQPPPPDFDDEGADGRYEA